MTVAAATAAPKQAEAIGEVGPLPEALRADWKLSAFYQKHVEVKGFPILGSGKVSDAALKEAAWIVSHELEGREDILRAMTRQHVRLVVMGFGEYTTDIPEHSHLQPKVYWDRRARGLGSTPEAPAVSCAEENLLAFPNDPYSTENILIHEFAHAIHETGMNQVDPAFDGRLEQAYAVAMTRGLWKGTYAATNRQEYWAEGVQSWFDNNRENDALHNHVNTRAELKEYDPALAALVAGVLGDRPWRYQKPDQRDAAGRAHLGNLPDAAHRPAFRWRDETIPERPLVLIQTKLGDIELELDTKAAPETVKNFLAYVHEGLYNDGIFFRTVTTTPDNQPDSAVKINVIQAQMNPAKEGMAHPPIKIETTKASGLKHKNGSISMAREGPDTASHHFFICIGDQPELDFGGKRNPDGQGFAAFGEVVRGMEVVEQIHAAPAEGQTLKPPVPVQRAIRRN